MFCFGFSAKKNIKEVSEMVYFYILDVLKEFRISDRELDIFIDEEIYNYCEAEKRFKELIEKGYEFIME